MTKVVRISTGSKEAPILENGQIIWLNGYGQSLHDHERIAIYGSETNAFGLLYKTVNLDKPATGKKEAFCIRHDSKIFGIGMYYTTGDLATPEEIETALILADQTARIKQQNSEAAAKAEPTKQQHEVKILSTIKLKTA